MIIKNGNVLNFEQNAFVKMDIMIEDGKITQVAPHIEGDNFIDATGKYITPGLIDAHSHICISEEGMGQNGDDCNDYSGALNPYLETIDAIYPFDIAVKDSVRNGVTAAAVCPGSDSVIGGVICSISLDGKIADEMVINRKNAMKCSLGENPKKAGNGFQSRMGTAYTLRKCLNDAIDYKHNKEVALKDSEYFKQDMGMENMLLVLNKEMPMHMHVHRSDDICTAIRIAKEYDINIVLVHCTDGISIVEYISQFNYPVIVGPTITPRSKQETWNKTFETAGVLHKAGLKVCITADHDVTPLYYLSVYAGMAVKAGLDEIEGLKAITKNPAEVLGIDHLKGDIKKGLDADIVVWDNHPFAYNTKVNKVFIKGKIME